MNSRFVRKAYEGVATPVPFGRFIGEAQTLDYFPYGSTRINNATSTNQKRKYIGQFFDDNTNLEYLNARYYSPDHGQFLSQDPSFLAIGNPSQVKGITGQDQLLFLPRSADDLRLNMQMLRFRSIRATRSRLCGSRLHYR